MGDEKKQISDQELQHQVTEYANRQPGYKQYADALKRVLENACKTSCSAAIVQTREKSLTSFAEKVVRKFGKYRDAVNQLTDLCGGRVIVQTLEQVKAVRQFIEANFKILEADEKGLRLGDDKFGYRDMHYLIKLVPEKAAALGFTPDEIKGIGDKTAEVQVRTWVQHAWADTLHDRMYKTPLKYPAEFRRAGALLAAIMEDGDRAFNRLAGDIDGMLANFNAYASPEEVERELGVQNLILATASESKKPIIALQIARLLAPFGDDAGVVDRLSPFADVASPLGCAIRSELGNALCQLHRSKPRSDAFKKGQAYLRRVVEYGKADILETVPDLRTRISTLARALARLAGSYGVLDEEAHKARECYRGALELEPDNPYYLSDVMGHEISYSRSREFVGAMAASVRRGIQTCREHICNGTEMPYAAFTAGRLHLLMDETNLALAAYARGIRHVLACRTCVPPHVFTAEEEWLILVTSPDSLAGGFRWAMDLLRLAGRVKQIATEPVAPPDTNKTPVLIVAGGATSLAPGQADHLRPMLVEALSGFNGTVFSGGTRVGVPGCVGDAADQVAPRGKRPFKLMGFIPRLRSDDFPKDDRYDECIECGEQGFSAEQILTNWAVILDAAIRPEDVRILGFGGGPLSALEYRIALALGATVGLVEGSGGAVDGLVKDVLWDGDDRLLQLPNDRASIRAFAQFSPMEVGVLTEPDIEKMAMAFHEQYVKASTRKRTENLQPWENLKDTFKSASREQARYAIQLLSSCGYGVRPASGPPALDSFAPEELDRMAEWEHGRWNIERLSDGWRRGIVRNDAQKLHDCIVPWSALSATMKEYDYNAVRAIPGILATAGLAVVRK